MLILFGTSVTPACEMNVTPTLSGPHLKPQQFHSEYSHEPPLLIQYLLRALKMMKIILAVMGLSIRKMQPQMNKNIMFHKNVAKNK